MKTCWVVSSDKKGTINQAIGIPERLGFDCEVKIVKLTWIDKFLGHINPRFLSYCKQINSLASQRQPDLIISAGHDGLIVNSALKTRNKNIINVHIQNPKRLGKYFDLIIVPKHDNLKPKQNLLVTNIGLHHITEQKLVEEKEKFMQKFGKIGNKIAFFAIGGKSAGYNLSKKWIEQFCEKIKELKVKHNVKIFITTSRRTKPEHQLLIKQMLDKDVVFIDDYKYNYYIGAMAACDYLFITNESVSMISEAVFTKKQVVMLKIPGFRLKTRRFNENIEHNGLGILQKIESIDFIAKKQINNIDDNEMVAKAIKKLIEKNE